MKDNGFINCIRKVYSIEEISDKQNTILVIFNHGSGTDTKLEKCLKLWNRLPPIIKNLHNKKLKNIYLKFIIFVQEQEDGQRVREIKCMMIIKKIKNSLLH